MLEDPTRAHGDTCGWDTASKTRSFMSTQGWRTCLCSHATTLTWTTARQRCPLRPSYAAGARARGSSSVASSPGAWQHNYGDQSFRLWCCASARQYWSLNIMTAFLWITPSCATWLWFRPLVCRLATRCMIVHHPARHPCSRTDRRITLTRKYTILKMNTKIKNIKKHFPAGAAV